MCPTSSKNIINLLHCDAILQYNFVFCNKRNLSCRILVILWSYVQLNDRRLKNHVLCFSSEKRVMFNCSGGVLCECSYVFRLFLLQTYLIFYLLVQNPIAIWCKLRPTCSCLFSCVLMSGANSSYISITVYFRSYHSDPVLNPMTPWDRPPLKNIFCIYGIDSKTEVSVLSWETFLLINKCESHFCLTAELILI